MTTFELFFCILLVFSSAFLSASEVALFSLSRFQLRYLKENFRNLHAVIKKLLADPGGLLVTILVSNEVINISLATLIEHAVLRLWNEKGASLFSWFPDAWISKTPDWFLQMTLGIAITLPIVLLGCEMTPKVIAARANQVIAPLTSPTLFWLHRFLKPIRILISWFISVLLGKHSRKKITDTPDGPLIQEEEFLFMVEEGHKEGLVHSSELELIRNIFELDDTKVEEICTPISKVHSFSTRTTLKQALDSYKHKNFSRVPVFDKDKHTIVGVLFAKDLIPARLDTSLQSQSVETVMKKPLYIKLGTKLNALFRSMRRNQTHMAVIVNQSERAIGIVTMNDLFVEIFGEHFESSKSPQSSSTHTPTKERA